MASPGNSFRRVRSRHFQTSDLGLQFIALLDQFPYSTIQFAKGGMGQRSPEVIDHVVDRLKQVFSGVSHGSSMKRFSIENAPGILTMDPSLKVERQKMALVVKPKAPTSAARIPDGTYRATLTGIKEFTNAYGERIGFEFTITTGPYAGTTVMRSTAPQLTRQSKLAEVIEGITGKPLDEKQLAAGVDLENLIDEPCHVLVLQSTSKAGMTYSNVERVFK